MKSFEQKYNDCSDKFERIFNITSIASKVIAPDLTILKVNNALVDLLGFKKEELLGTRILDYACEEYKAHWRNLQKELWGNKVDEFVIEACLIKKDKSLVWVKVTTVLFTEDGNTYGYSVLDDFTYRKEFEQAHLEMEESLAISQLAEKKLKLNEQRLTRVLETMAEGVAIIDNQGKTVYVNPKARQILGYTGKDHLKKHYASSSGRNLRVDGTLLPFAEHPITIMMVNRKAVFDREIIAETPNQNKKYISINAAPLIDESGELIGGIGTFMDITAKRKLTILKDEFITVASHELNTPITSLQGTLQLLKRVKHMATDPKMPRLIDQANNSMNYLTVLIADLLQATRMSEGQPALRKTNFKLSALIANCCNYIRLNDEYKLIAEGDEELTIYADADRIDQVLTNFISNAIKYASLSKTIKIVIEDLGNDAKVSVIDEGPGIAADKVEQLFQKYSGIDLEGNQDSGLGLGLYLSSEIIKRHNGSIGVESKINKGSKFWFTLPKEIV